MPNIMRSIGIVFLLVGGAYAYHFYTISTEQWQHQIVIAIVFLAIVFGATFFFFGAVIKHLEDQSVFLEDIRDHFYPDNDNDEV